MGPTQRDHVARVVDWRDEQIEGTVVRVNIHLMVEVEVEVQDDTEGRVGDKGLGPPGTIVERDEEVVVE